MWSEEPMSLIIALSACVFMPASSCSGANSLTHCCVESQGDIGGLVLQTKSDNSGGI